MVKLIMKHTKPELSSLLCAVDTYQSDLVQLFGEQLKKPLEKHANLLLPMQRFIELSKEIMLKTTSEEKVKLSIYQGWENFGTGYDTLTRVKESPWGENFVFFFHFKIKTSFQNKYMLIFY